MIQPAIFSSPVERSVTMLSELLVEEMCFANLISSRTLFYPYGKILSI
jgi:hypothetical protein